jgi:hypothetical protein
MFFYKALRKSLEMATRLYSANVIWEEQPQAWPVSFRLLPATIARLDVRVPHSGSDVLEALAQPPQLRLVPSFATSAFYTTVLVCYRLLQSCRR